MKVLTDPWQVPVCRVAGAFCWLVRSGYAWTWREWAEPEVVMRPDAVGRTDKGTRLHQGPVACLVLFDHLYLTATPFVLTAYSP